MNEIEQPEMIVGWVRGCARCGEYHQVEWHKFTRPIVDKDGAVWAYWGMCPTVSEPVLLMRVTEETATP